MKKILISIRPRGDGKYFVHSEWSWGMWTHRKTGLTEEEVIKEVTEQIKGTLQEWSKN